MKLKLTNQETAAVLCGLRLYQIERTRFGPGASLPYDLQIVATDDESFPALGADEVELLCVRINLSR